MVMWYMLQQTEEPKRGRSRGPPFKPLSDFFGIWHEYQRGEEEKENVRRRKGEGAWENGR